MISEGRIIGDGSWELQIYVTDLQVERTLRVKSDLHIGGVMLKLVEALGKIAFYCYDPSIKRSFDLTPLLPFSKGL